MLIAKFLVYFCSTATETVRRVLSVRASVCVAFSFAAVDRERFWLLQTFSELRADMLWGLWNARSDFRVQPNCSRQHAPEQWKTFRRSAFLKILRADRPTGRDMAELAGVCLQLLIADTLKLHKSKHSESWRIKICRNNHTSRSKALWILEENRIRGRAFT